MKTVKENLLDLAIADIEKQIEAAERGRKDAIEESKAHKGAMASRYDTFKEEAQYLAGGFAARIQELTPLLAALNSLRMNTLPTTNKVAGCAIVEIEDLNDGTKAKYFLLPAGGGESYEVGGEKYVILTPRAPLARAIMGKVAGDEVEMTIQGTTRKFLVVSVT